MFLSIPESVMNSHIKLTEAFLPSASLSLSLSCIQLMFHAFLRLYCSEGKFRTVRRVFEITVFEHPTFCDELSHLMNRSFPTFCKSFSESLLHPIDVSHIVKALEDRKTYCIALKENFELLSESLK